MAVRSCVSCGKKQEKQNLRRFVWRDGAPVHDTAATLDGRGAYCCDKESCLATFEKHHKKYKRIFRLA